MTQRIGTPPIAIDPDTIHFGLCQIPTQYVDHFDVLDNKDVACIRLWVNRTEREGYSAIISLHCQTQEKTREAAAILLKRLPVHASPFSSITASKNYETQTTSIVTFVVNGDKHFWIQLSDYFPPEKFTIQEGGKVGKFKEPTWVVAAKDTETCEMDTLLEKMNRCFVNNHIAHKLGRPSEPRPVNTRCINTQGNLGGGKERWFEIYSDRVTRRCFTESFKSIETPSCQDEMYLWFLNPDALLAKNS